MTVNNLISERFGDSYRKESNEIPYRLAVKSIIEYDKRVKKRADRTAKIKNFFKKAGAILCLR